MTKPAFESIPLERGVTLHHRRSEHFKTDVVRLWLRAPFDERRAERNLFASLLRRGTRRHPTQRAVNQHLENLYAATFGVGVFGRAGRHGLAYRVSSVSGRFLPGRPDNLARAMRFLGQALEGPARTRGRVDDVIFEQERESLLRDHRSRIDSKARYALERLQEEMFPGCSYGWPGTGREADILAAEQAECLDEGLRVIAEGEADVYVVARCTAAHAEKLVRRHLRLEPRRQERFRGLELAPPRRRARLVRERQDVNQARLAMGFRLPEWRLGEASLSVALADAILGGGTASKLFRHVRERLSLCYDIRSYFDPVAGAIYVSCGIDPAAYARVRREVMRQVAAMAVGNITDDEISTARRALLNALDGLDDDQDALASYFFGKRLLKRRERSIDEVVRRVRRADPAGVPELVARARLDTVFLLDPAEVSA